MYGLSNNEKDSLKFDNTVFRDNGSLSNLMYLLDSNLELAKCKVINNRALYVTHGVALV